MKKNDLMQVLFFSVVAAVATYFIAGIFIHGPRTTTANAPVVEKYDSNFPQADPKVFNDNALDPTKDITIDKNNNEQPFRNK